MRIIPLTVAAATLIIASSGVVRADVAINAAPAPGRPDHIVVVVMENKRYDSVVGHPKTPYISSLAKQGANFTAAYGETHPSQPNYLALFSGSTQGVTDNKCGHTFTGVPNLGQQLFDAGHTFIGYAEDLPSVGYQGCADKEYVRRHNPWVNFPNVPTASNRPLRDFPTDYSKLPTVAFVVPGLCNDMHDCPKLDADTWLKQFMGPYITWAKQHNSLFMLTFDEDNRTGGNHIPTLILGEHVTSGDRAGRIDHYTLLRTIEAQFGLAPLGAAADRTPIPLH